MKAPVTLEDRRSADSHLSTSITPRELPKPLAERVGYLLSRNHQELRDRAERALEPFGLGERTVDCSPKHVVCLSLIASQGPMSQQELGELIMVDRTTIVAVVDWLEDNELVERKRNPADRRAYALQVTDKGREWLKEANGALRATERQFLAPLTAEERRQLIGLLQRLLIR
jgi:DNA-binding MarR family transcriptional regulator